MVGVELVQDAYFSSMFSKVTAHLTVHVGELGAGMAEEGVVSAVRAWVTSEPATGSCNSLVSSKKRGKKERRNGGQTIFATEDNFPPYGGRIGSGRDAESSVTIATHTFTWWEIICRSKLARSREMRRLARSRDVRR